MKWFEQADLPRTVYRFFDRDKVLLYVGCSINPFTRWTVHLVHSPWVKDITTMTVEWYPNWITGARAEMTAIVNEHPKYNKLVFDPTNVGAETLRKTNAVPRGDGVSCPKCHKPKERRSAAYCRACTRVYTATRRAKLFLKK